MRFIICLSREVAATKETSEFPLKTILMTRLCLEMMEDLMSEETALEVN
jgi:hypothetical protein